jgi:hypothetical protein
MSYRKRKRPHSILCCVFRVLTFYLISLTSSYLGYLYHAVWPMRIFNDISEIIRQWWRDPFPIRGRKLVASASSLCFFLWGGPKSLGTAATSGLLYKPQMRAEGDCGAIGGMKIGRGNRSTRRKPAPAPLCPPQIPHDQTRARTRATAMGSQRLTVWAMALPSRTI